MDQRTQEQQDAAIERMLDDLFTYHPPTPEQLEKYARISESMRAAARVVLQTCPASPDRTAAIRLIREARMTANASIATKTGAMDCGAYTLEPFTFTALGGHRAQGPVEVDVPPSSEGGHGA